LLAILESLDGRVRVSLLHIRLREPATLTLFILREFRLAVITQVPFASANLLSLFKAVFLIDPTTTTHFNSKIFQGCLYLA